MHAPRDEHSSDARLPDGSYDAFVVWIDERDDDMLAIDLTIIDGAHKGDVVCVVAPADVTRTSLRVAPHADALDLVGVPCTLHVVDGAPRLAWTRGRLHSRVAGRFAAHPDGDRARVGDPGSTCSSPERIRTAVTALRGRRPGPLDDGARGAPDGAASQRDHRREVCSGGRTRTPKDRTRTCCVADYTTPEWAVHVSRWRAPRSRSRARSLPSISIPSKSGRPATRPSTTA